MASNRLMLISVLSGVLSLVFGVKNGGLRALSDFEYDVMIRKIIDTYNTPMSDRSKEVLNILDGFSSFRSGVQLF